MTIDEPGIATVTVLSWRDYVTHVPEVGMPPVSCPNSLPGAIDFEVLGAFDMVGKRLLSYTSQSDRLPTIRQLLDYPTFDDWPDRYILVVRKGDRQCSFVVAK